MSEITQAEKDILTEAVDTIVDRERQIHPEQDSDFWGKFRDVLLEDVIERRQELLPSPSNPQ